MITKVAGSPNQILSNVTVSFTIRNNSLQKHVLTRRCKTAFLSVIRLENSGTAEHRLMQFFRFLSSIYWRRRRANPRTRSFFIFQNSGQKKKSLRIVLRFNLHINGIYFSIYQWFGHVLNIVAEEDKLNNQNPNFKEAT